MTELAELSERLQAALGADYAVERPLGEGGFAVVFLVRDLALKRRLAVKVLSPDLVTSRAVLERFRREAETVAQLTHPNIVPLHFIGQRDDLLYLAMPCVEGGSIADRLEREGPLPVPDVVRIVGEVASALAYSHKRGVIHRDIKPANVLVDADSGRCLVTDFGIARTAEGSTLTATGMMLGTPAYLAPEQVTGEGLDHRVDIFALGVLAYELLAGKVPYDAPTPTAAMMKRLAGPPVSITVARPDVPESLASLITACLAADPAERVQDAADVVAALNGERSIAITKPRAVTWPPATSAAASSRTRLIAIAVLGVALLGASVSWFNGRTGEPAVAASTSATPPVTPPASLVAIPGGDYTIGSDRGPAFVRPRHVTTVAGFEIERTEVTVGAYAAFVAATAAPAPWKNGARPDSLLPVTGVTYGDAATYCKWKYPEGGRLPTEFEWEAAARGAAAREYPYGGAPDVAAANTASAQRNAPGRVGSFPRGATPEGVQDLSGNVWEWTSSARAGYPNGPALPPAETDMRVIRGGAFNTPDSLATTWMRGFYPASTRSDELPYTGFRCAR